MSLARGFSFIAVSLLATLAGCGIAEPPVPGSGKITTTERSLTDFKAVSVALGANVELKVGDKASVSIKSDDNLEPLIRTEVVDGTLKIKTEGNLAPSKPIELVIVAPEVASFSIAGSGRVTIEKLAGPETEVSIAGSSDVQTAVAAEKFIVDVAGSGTVAATGEAKTVTVSIAGSADVNVVDIKADTAAIEIAGGGTVRIHAAKSLEVSVAGSGDVRYSGSPEIKKSIAGSGTISALTEPAAP